MVGVGRTTEFSDREVRGPVGAIAGYVGNMTQASRYCSGCGVGVGAADAYCPSCGTRVQSSTIAKDSGQGLEGTAGSVGDGGTVVGDVTHGSKVVNYGTQTVHQVSGAGDETRRESRSQNDGSENFRGGTLVGDFAKGDIIKNSGQITYNTTQHHTNDLTRLAACGVCDTMQTLLGGRACEKCGKHVCAGCSARWDTLRRNGTKCLSCARDSYARRVSEVLEDGAVTALEEDSLRRIVEDWDIPRGLCDKWYNEMAGQLLPRRMSPFDWDEAFGDACGCLRGGDFLGAKERFDRLHKLHRDQDSVRRSAFLRAYSRTLIEFRPVDAERVLIEEMSTQSSLDISARREIAFGACDCEVRIRGARGTMTAAARLDELKLDQITTCLARIKHLELGLDAWCLSGDGGDAQLSRVADKLARARGDIRGEVHASSCEEDLQFVEAYLVACKHGRTPEIGNPELAARLGQKLDWMRAGELLVGLDYGKRFEQFCWPDGGVFGRNARPLYELVLGPGRVASSEFQRLWSDFQRSDRQDWSLTHGIARNCLCDICRVAKDFRAISRWHFAFYRRRGSWCVASLKCEAQPELNGEGMDPNSNRILPSKSNVLTIAGMPEFRCCVEIRDYHLFKKRDNGNREMR